jgi:hypothetical protein
VSAAEDRVERPLRSSMTALKIHASNSSGSESSVLDWLGIALDRCASHGELEAASSWSIRLRSAWRGQHPFLL